MIKDSRSQTLMCYPPTKKLKFLKMQRPLGLRNFVLDLSAVIKTM